MAGKMSRAAWLLMARSDRHDMESKYRDGRGREHYDNGRFAPMRNDTNIEIEGRFRDDSGFERYEDGRFAPVGWYDEIWDGHIDDRYPHRRPAPIYRSDDMRGSYEMRPIGFDAGREWDGSHQRARIDYEPRNEMEHRSGSRATGYARGSEDDVEPLTRERAERWVQSMHNASGMRGQHWTMDQAKQIMARCGYQDDPVEFYAALNMMMSDYAKAAQKLGVDKEDFYAAMAHAFLNDDDAQRDKLARYYRYVVM